MRINGQVIGAPRTMHVRRSVILRSDGLELVLVFCGYASRSTPDQSPPIPSAPAAPRNERRPNLFFIYSSCRVPAEEQSQARRSEVTLSWRATSGGRHGPSAEHESAIGTGAAGASSDAGGEA